MSGALLRITFAVSFLALFSCVDVIELDYPGYVEKAVMTGVLNPDSAVTIRLTKTFPPGRTFDPMQDVISHAVVKLYENERLAGQLQYIGGGYYQMAFRPKSGSVYTVEAVTPFGTLRARESLVIPPLPNFAVTTGQRHNPNANPDFLITLPQKTKGNYWIAIRETKNGVESGQGWHTIVSNSPYLDTFNASDDQFFGVKNYGYLARILPEIKDSLVVIVSTFNQLSTIFRNGGGLEVRVSYVSENYDSFLRSAVLAADTRLLTMDGDLNNPFYEPTTISSTIEGGLGIVGGVHIIDFTVDKLP